MERQDQILENSAMNRQRLTEIETVLSNGYSQTEMLQQAAVLLREAIFKCNEILQTQNEELQIYPQVYCGLSPLVYSNTVTRDNKEVNTQQFAYSSTS